MKKNRTSTTSLLVESSNVFCSKGHIAETGIIDHITQCAMALSADEGSHIAEVKNFNLNFLPKIGETMETSVNVLSGGKGKMLLNATATVEGETAASCVVKIHIKDQVQ